MAQAASVWHEVAPLIGVQGWGDGPIMLLEILKEHSWTFRGVPLCLKVSVDIGCGVGLVNKCGGEVCSSHATPLS